MANSLLTKWLSAMTTDSNGNDAIKLQGATGDQETQAKSWETAFRSAMTIDDKLRNISK